MPSFRNSKHLEAVAMLLVGSRAACNARINFCLAMPIYWPYILLNYCVLQLSRGRIFFCLYHCFSSLNCRCNAHSRNLNSEASTNFLVYEIITQLRVMHTWSIELQYLALLFHL